MSSRSTLGMQQFLQVIMHNEVLSDQEVSNECVRILGERSHVRCITEINNSLSSINMAIQSGKDELTGEIFWAFVPTIKDEKMRYQSKYTQAQLDLLRAIFLEILDSENGFISSIDALNIQSTLEPRLSHAEAETTIGEMVSSKWLSSKEGNIYIGVRSTIELMPFFRASHHDEFNACPICDRSLFHGHKCENCQAVHHLYCLGIAKKRTGMLECFKCKKTLNATDLPCIDLNSSRGSQAEQDGTPSPPIKIKGKGKKRKEH
ncbi:hypothetical protein HCN44_004167 [Aphidius gifuensis]|uniref:Non-structural maintenance of chromosomes element 1 homolog n=1 Tax=Aphidius gifuensis TaxID=684658 RepID=A0A834XWE2_APHGI|nr:non-structural maintenance of chromosomes element 1 homolog [Aphidius gifuensis]KAF7994695.1 hypothetical protein HCN44_004167 [Aphidius gifuensis]